ncbi:MAG: hypothetical protein WBD96_18450 [Pseudolabrys sp.]
MVKRQKQAGRRRSSAEAEMKAFLASKAVDQISEYSQRGRSYRDLSDRELVQSWQTVWNELAADPLNMKNRDIQADLASEFALRQEEPPWLLVREQIDIYLERAKRAQQIQLKETPDADAEASEAMDDDFEEFMNRRSN